MDGRKIAKFVKVFSLKSFPLYGKYYEKSIAQRLFILAQGCVNIINGLEYHKTILV